MTLHRSFCKYNYKCTLWGNYAVKIFLNSTDPHSTVVDLVVGLVVGRILFRYGNTRSGLGRGRVDITDRLLP
jgi:hypothetical protein